MSAAGRHEILVPVSPGERTLFAFEVAERLPIRRCWLHSGPPHRPCCRLRAPVWIQQPQTTSVPLVLSVEFSTEAADNTLCAREWRRLYGSDYEARPDIFVPLLGRMRWRSLLADGILSGGEKIVGIDVDTGDHRIFSEMLEALDWADSLRKPTIYFYRYEPGFERVLRRI
ncbi:MAG: hypothetical protein AAB676_10370 [Verrucomicrobiota bacterium]